MEQTKTSGEKLDWTALEYEEKEHGNDWFWALGVIVIAGSITSFIYANYFFGLLLIIGGILLAVFAIKKPDLVKYELNKDGLKIRNRLYPYESIKAFYLEDEKLFIKTERAFMPIMSLPIDPTLTYQIKNILLAKKIPEEEMKEHVSEKIMDSLGF